VPTINDKHRTQNCRTNAAKQSSKQVPTAKPNEKVFQAQHSSKPDKEPM